MPRYFSPAMFQFLRQLEENNERSWWKENESRYVTVVREPALAFIGHFAAPLRAISTHFTADPKTVGGSLMRPYRDTRFSHDKTPYKTNVGIQFRHELGKDIHAPGFYVHLEPEACFAGVGMWHPETAVARQIRSSILERADEWSAATKTADFTSTWSLASDDDEMLKRVPADFPPDHEHAGDLRMKSFVAGRSLTHKQVTSASFVDDLAAMYHHATAFTRFLCETLDLPF
jgi:uncharacterized protein (TIGR02453 family)